MQHKSSHPTRAPPISRSFFLSPSNRSDNRIQEKQSKGLELIASRVRRPVQQRASIPRRSVKNETFQVDAQ